MKITLNQLNNILVFLSVIIPSKEILNHNPDYIIEKFEHYIGDPTLVKDDKSYMENVHPLLRKELIIPYINIWFKDGKLRKQIIGDLSKNLDD